MTPQRVTVAGYLADRWLPAIEDTVRPTTFDGYRRIVRLYLVPALGRVPLQGLTPDQLSTLYRQLRASGGLNGRALSPATVARVHATAHRALRDAVSEVLGLRWREDRLVPQAWWPAPAAEEEPVALSLGRSRPRLPPSTVLWLPSVG